MMKGLFFFVVLAFAITWVTASFSGGDMQIADLVIDFMMFSFVLIAFMSVSIFGWDQITKAMFKLRIMKKMRFIAESDATKALGVMVGAPFMIMFSMLSILTQCNRKCLSCTKRLDESERKFFLTLNAYSLLRTMMSWNLTSIMVWIHWWAIIYFTLNVGIRVLTYVFLSWLIETLESLGNFFLIVGIYLVVGVVLFLFPPVPGPPIYMTGGVLLVQTGQDKFGYWNSILIVILLGFLLKMIAITMQQKGFGEQLGKKVWVRKTVGINSLFIRALRKILSEPGMHLSKVAVLIGGPDWPTSVLTGIMGLPLPSMLFGSIPIIFLIIPCVLTGAFQLKSPDKLCGAKSPCTCDAADDDSETWQSMSVFIILFTAMTQSASSILAMYYVDKCIDGHETELMSNEAYRDVEVEKLEKEEAKSREAYAHVTKWENMPASMKKMLMFGSLCCSTLVWLANTAYSRCFVRKFQITSKIECLPGGVAHNAIKPGGWIIIGLFIIECFILRCYYAWAKKAVANHLADADGEKNVKDTNADGPVKGSGSGNEA
jgi:hypothetical protein